MNTDKFRGAKLALIRDDKLLIYRRDQKADIPFPGLLDMPGGGREGKESAEKCVLRELQEEFGIDLSEDRLTYRRKYANSDGVTSSYFFVSSILELELNNISFGTEGEYWALMGIREYLEHPDGIPLLQTRLKDYLSSRSGT